MHHPALPAPAMIHLGVERQLRRLGLNSCYRGYLCLIHGALLVDRDPELLDMPSKLLYPEIARRCHLTPGGVDRAIRTAIRVCRRRSPEGVEQMCGGLQSLSVQQFLAGLSPYCGGRQR